MPTIVNETPTPPSTTSTITITSTGTSTSTNTSFYTPPLVEKVMTVDLTWVLILCLILICCVIVLVYYYARRAVLSIIQRPEKMPRSNTEAIFNPTIQAWWQKSS